ncbi:MAG: DUF234 domain-containing protein [Thermoproteales archaeon]|nr:DUF234 domain-containing protein [Thermoproteales archaeon]
MAKIDPRGLTKYIVVLEELDILERVKPLGYRRPVILDFKDHYFRFWFTYNYKLRSLLEAGMMEEAYEHVLRTLNDYFSKVFEKIILEILPHLYRAGILPVGPMEVGKWWYKDLEVDAVVRDPGLATVFIEVEWSSM